MSANERSGWRDMELSLRHRDWGFNCPAADIDFLMVEYNVGKPVALVEYKRFTAKAPDTTHPTYRAIRDLADGYREGGLPFYMAFYWPTTWAFKIYPLNDRARKFFQHGERLTEEEYVQRIYRMRGHVTYADVHPKLHRALPPEDFAPQILEAATHA